MSDRCPICQGPLPSSRTCVCRANQLSPESLGIINRDWEQLYSLQLGTDVGVNYRRLWELHLIYRVGEDDWRWAPLGQALSSHAKIDAREQLEEEAAIKLDQWEEHPYATRPIRFFLWWMIAMRAEYSAGVVQSFCPNQPLIDRGLAAIEQLREAQRLRSGHLEQCINVMCTTLPREPGMAVRVLQGPGLFGSLSATATVYKELVSK